MTDTILSDCLFDFSELPDTPIHSKSQAFLPPPEEGYLPKSDIVVRDTSLEEIHENDARYQMRLREEENQKLYDDSLIKEGQIRALFCAVMLRQIKDAIRLDMRLGNADDAKEGDFESTESVQKRAIDWIIYPNFTGDFEDVCELAGLPSKKTRKCLTNFLIQNSIIDSEGNINPNADYEKTKENFNLLRQNIGGNDDIERL